MMMNFRRIDGALFADRVHSGSIRLVGIVAHIVDSVDIDLFRVNYRICVLHRCRLLRWWMCR